MYLLILVGLYLYFQPSIPSITEIFQNYYKIIGFIILLGFFNLRFLKKSTYYDEQHNNIPKYFQKQNQYTYQLPQLSENRRNIIAARQSWCCNHCSQVLDKKFKSDYVIPLHKGGDKDIDNVQCLCSPCFQKKQILDLSF